MQIEPMYRNAEPHDAAPLAALGMQVWLHTYATTGVSDTLARYVLAEFTPAKFEALIASDAAQVLVAELADHLVGYAVVSFDTVCPARAGPTPGSTTELATLYVQTHFARRGIGARLLDRAAALALVRGRAGLWLTVNAQNRAAIAFYARHGYQPVGTAYFDLGGARHENHVLVATNSASAQPCVDIDTPIHSMQQTLGHDGIEALIPHSGAMCLLDRLCAWDMQHIACRASNHRDAAHPLRSRSGLLAPVAIEYAAQAMALHGALIGQATGAAATPGYLASARSVQLHVLRLDNLPLNRELNGEPVGHPTGAPDEPDELHIEATRQAGDAQQILYAFAVTHQGRPVAEGRAAVVLNTALAA